MNFKSFEGSGIVRFYILMIFPVTVAGWGFLNFFCLLSGYFRAANNTRVLQRVEDLLLKCLFTLRHSPEGVK